MDKNSHNPKSERELIRRIAEDLINQPEPEPERAEARVAFGDDMAGIPDSGGWLWSVDMLMDGVDFRSAEHGWETIGRKAMSVSLSDCAAMAVRPLAALCAVALCDSLTIDDAVAIHRGAQSCASEYGCRIVGGDTNSWKKPTVVSVTIVGRAEPGLAPVRRSGACVGDEIHVSGLLGGSILGRHLTVRPRVELALELNRHHTPHAMIDISDGLSIDLGHILDSSACGAELNKDALDKVVHPDARRLARQTGRPPLEHALHDGEDFELVVVLAQAADKPTVERLGLTRIGHITKTGGLKLRHSDGKLEPIEPRGWEHFR